ncbi:unnamed protein product [Aureobasidium vineae]|uniref:Fungal N-terminal domain-containing protein n=1 Tax=Aureobasidium vineae TaxID=2773715 RepID=A0A9N8J9G2_9PEZI|nr:unnamed protein product [Aureobasidium vineae]
MADPFTIAASVGGLTSLGIQLLQSLNKYTGSALDSKGRIKAISMDIDLTVQVFQALDTTIKDDANRVMMNDDAERLARDAITQCRELFTMIQSTLPGLGPDGPRMRNKITYPLIEPELELLRGNLEKVKTTLQLLMQVIMFAAMSKRSAEQASLGRGGGGNKPKNSANAGKKKQVPAFTRWMLGGGTRPRPKGAENPAAGLDPSSETLGTTAQKPPTLDDLLEQWTNLPSVVDALDENEEA